MLSYLTVRDATIIICHGVWHRTAQYCRQEGEAVPGLQMQLLLPATYRHDITTTKDEWDGLNLHRCWQPVNAAQVCQQHFTAGDPSPSCCQGYWWCSHPAKLLHSLYQLRHNAEFLKCCCHCASSL